MNRVSTLAAGALAVVALTWVWHSPLGVGERFATDVEARARAQLDHDEMLRVQARFERVRINVGKWDRHEGLRRSFDVRALATYIVLDPKTSRQLAKTTLEPISKKSQKLSAEEWARWLNEH